MFCRTFFGLTVLLCGLAFLDRAVLVNYNFFTGIYNPIFDSHKNQIPL